MDSPWKSIGIMETETGLFYVFSTKFLEMLGTLDVRHQLQIVDIIENYVDNNYYPTPVATLITKAGVCLGKQPLFFKIKIWVHEIIKIKRIKIIDSDQYLDMYNQGDLL